MKNKKLIAAIASLSLVVVAVVAAIVGVLAASQQNVAGNFRVAYTANDVSAVVALAKKADGASEFTTTAGEGEKTTHTFVKADTTSTQTLTFVSESLTVAKKWVLYKFTFQNTNTAYGMDITSTYTYAANSNVNVDVYYAWGATAPSVEYTTTPEVATVSNGTALAATGNLGGVQTAAKVGTGDTVTLYIIVAIHDLNADAHYELGASGENTLVFNLTRHDVAPSA